MKRFSSKRKRKRKSSTLSTAHVVKLEQLEDRRLLCSAPAGDDFASRSDQEHEVCEVVLGEAIDGKIDYRRDIDDFRIELEETRWLQVVNSTAEGEVRVINSSGSVLHWGPQRGVWQAQANTTYFVSVTGLSAGRYSFTVSPTIDDHADAFDQATPLELGQSADGWLQTDVDADTFSFEVEAGAQYAFDVKTSNFSSGLSLSLFEDAADAEPAFSYTGDFSRPWRANVTGTVYAQFVNTRSSFSEYSIQVQRADDHANGPAGATVISSNRIGTGDIEVSGDVDWFAFDASADSVYRMLAFSKGSTSQRNQFVPQLQLYDRDGKTPIDLGWTYSQSEAQFQPTVDGTYYAAVSKYGAGRGQYDVVLLEYAATPFEVNAPNGQTFSLGVPNSPVASISNHETLGDGTASLSFFSSAGDHVYDIDVRPRTVSDTTLTLKNSLVNTSFFDDDSGYGLGSRFLLEAEPVAAEIGVEISTYGEAGDYDVAIVARPDDHGSSRAEAISMELGEVHVGELPISSDVDVLRFDVVEGEYYYVRGDFLRPSNTNSLRAVGFDGRTIQGTLDNWLLQASDSEAYLTFRDTSEKSPASPGRSIYRASVTPVGDDFPDLQTDEPVFVPFNEQIIGRLEHRDDIDYMAFEAEVGDIFKFSVDPNVSITLLRPDRSSSSLQADDSWSPEQTGTHFLSIRRSRNAPISYTVEIEKTDLVDDHSSLRDATAKLLDLGVPVSHSAQANNDVDVFAFDAVEGQGYRFRPLESPIFRVSVFEQEGNSAAALGRSVDADKGVTWKAKSTGRHYISINYGSDVEAHTSVLELVPDDHPGTFEDVDAIAGFGEQGIAKGQFEVAGDVDLFSFESQGNEWFRFSHLDSTFRPTADIFDATGTSIGYLRTDRTGGNEWKSTDAGVYFFAPRYASDIESYEWQLERWLDDFPDSPDPTLPGLDGQVVGELSVNRDADYIPVDLPEGYELFVDSDLDVRLRDEDNRQISSSRTIRYRAADDVRVYIYVASSTPTPYELTIYRADDANSFRGDIATPVEADQPIRGLIIRRDIDTFRFDAMVGERIIFDSPSSVQVSIYDPEDKRIIDRAEDPIFDVTATGRHYAVVRTVASEDIAYEFSFRREVTEVDDHPNSPATATTVLANGIVSGMLNSNTDRDVFVFDAVKGQVEHFTFTGDPFVNVVILSDANENIAEGRGDFYFVPIRDRRYYVSVQGTNESNPSSYTLRREQIIDDHSDERDDTATKLTFGVPVPFRLTSRIDSDADVFSFNVQQDAVYSIHVPDTIAYFEIENEAGRRIGNSRERFAWRATADELVYVSVMGANGEFEITANQIVDDHSDVRSQTTSTISVGEIATSEHQIIDDVDWLKIEAEAGLYRVQVSGEDLFNANAEVVTGSETIGTVFGRNGTLWVEVIEGTDSYVRTESDQGSYQLELTRVADDHAGTFNAEATPLVTNEILVGAIQSPVDRDVFSVSVDAGLVIDVEVISGTLNANDAVLRVYDQAGELLIGASNRSTRLLATDDVYYVQVSASRLGAYDIVLRTEAADDDHGNETTSATLLEAGQNAVGEFEFANDVDVFAIDVEEATRGLRVGHVAGAASNGVSLQLLDADGAVLPLNAEFTAGGGSYKLPNAGRYYVRMDAASTGTYSVRVEQLEDDHADSKDSEPVVVESRLGGQIEVAYDVDVFAVEAVPLQSITVSPPDDVSVILQDGNGQTVPVYAPNVTGWKVPVAGTYYFVVTAEQPTSYSISLQLQQDDFGDTNETASRLANDSEITGEITAWDEDYFYIDISLGGLSVFLVDLENRFLMASWLNEAGDLISASDRAVKFAEPGRYYLRMNNPRPSTVATPYSFSVLVFPEIPDGPGVTFGFTEELDRFAVPALVGNKDAIQIDLMRGDRVDFGIDPSNSGLELVRGDGTVVQSGTGRLNWRADSTSSYYIVVDPRSALAPEVSFLYTISADVIEDDFPDDPGTTDGQVALRSGLSRRGTLIDSTDRDVFSLPMAVGDMAEIELEISSAARGRSYILDADGNVLDSSSQGKLYWKAVDEGPYFVEVRMSQTSDVSRAYTLKRKPNVSDDWPDVPSASVATISAGGTVSGNIEIPEFEKDVFAIDLEIAGDYQIDVINSAERDEPEESLRLSYKVFAADGETQLSVSGRRWTAESPGRYYLELSSARELGSYEVGYSAVPAEAAPAPIDAENIDDLFATQDRDTVFDLLRERGVELGDLDLDGNISFADFLVLSQNFGQAGGWEDGDINGDRRVGFDDFLLLAESFRD